jgi:transposase
MVFGCILNAWNVGDFRWPAAGEEAVMNLDVKELSYLIEGAKLEKKLKRKEVIERLIT